MRSARSYSPLEKRLRMRKKTKYLVLSDREEPSLEWEAAMQGALGICHTFAKAYEIGLFLSGITAPRQKYRKSLEIIKARGAVRLESQKEEPGCIIVRVKIY